MRCKRIFGHLQQLPRALGAWDAARRRPWRRGGAVGVEVLLVRGALGGGRRWRRGGEVGAEVTGGEETRRGASSMDAEAQARRPPPPLEAPSGGGQMRI